MNTKLPKVWRMPAICLLAVIQTWTDSSATAQNQSATSQSTAGDGGYVCVNRGPHSKLWQRTVTNQFGLVKTNSYTEKATGLEYSQNGQFTDAVEQIDAVADGAQAIQGQHQVHWAANANTVPAVTLTTVDGNTLSATIYALGYWDMATGSNVVLAQLQDSTGVITDANKITYANSFSNLNADIVYKYRRAGLSQDIVLKQNPPSPADYGLNPATTYLQSWTEWFNPPAPAITAVTNDNSGADDRILSFGAMRMGVGHAFLVQSDTQAVGAGSVLKSWTNIAGRTFLIEQISYSSISNLLSSLHSSTLKPDKGRVRRTVSLDPPRPRKVSAIQPAQSVKVAKSTPKETGFSIDYELLTTEPDFTFPGNQTFLISDLCNMSGTTVMEGGAVLKYTNNSTAEISVDDLVCASAAYRPIILTSMNDSSVGDPVSGSTGNPWTNYAGLMALYFPNQTATLQNIRFSHLAAGVSFQESESDTGGYLTMTNFQVVDCKQVVMSDSATCSLCNGLVYSVSNLFGHYGTRDTDDGQSLTAVNLTVHHCGDYATDQSSLMYITNCLFVEATNIYNPLPYLTFTNSTYVLTNDAGIFATVGAAGGYLADGSLYRNAGTTNIDPGLLADLQTKTTYPPVVLPVGWFTNDYTFFPQAQRDNNASTVACGYHYDALDYAVAIAISNATATVLPGTVLALMGSSLDYGVMLYSAATFNCAGTATSPNYLVRYNTVQEQSNTNWATTDWEGSLYANPIDATWSTANFRFTEWSVLGADVQFDAESGNVEPIGWQDCQFYGGTMYVLESTILSTNCLYQRVCLQLSDVNGTTSHSFYNNLFWGGELDYNHGDVGIWTFRDNLFDQTTNSMWANPIDICSNNAYVTTNFGLVLPTNGYVILTNSPAYETGALGEYYYPTNQTNLIHAGSRSAADAGLYHYTVITNNLIGTNIAIEGTNIVSIGFHYVATDTNGVPLDSNGDGIPDYLEDKNGNGVVDSGEIAWNTNDLGLVVWITQPANNSKIP